MLYVVFYIFAALLSYELLSSLKHFVFDKRQKKKQPKKYILMNDYFLVIGLIGHAFFFGIMAICVVWQSLSPQYTPTENYEFSFITILYCYNAKKKKTLLSIMMTIIGVQLWLLSAHQQNSSRTVIFYCR